MKAVAAGGVPERADAVTQIDAVRGNPARIGQFRKWNSLFPRQMRGWRGGVGVGVVEIGRIIDRLQLLLIRVRDHGTGLPRDMAGAIGQRFRANRTSRKAPGSGWPSCARSRSATAVAWLLSATRAASPSG